jgi:hypothetical protein
VGETSTLEVDIAAAIAEQFEDYCWRQGLTLDEGVDMALREFLDEHDPRDWVARDRNGERIRGLKTATVDAVVVLLANGYRYVFATVFSQVHGGMSDALRPNLQILVIAKYILRLCFAHCPVDQMVSDLKSWGCNAMLP